jgi:nicotinamidase-related amidase
MANTSKPSYPSYYSPSETAILLFDYQNIHINTIENPERKQKLIDSVNTLLTAAHKNKVAIVHCLVDTKADPPITSKIHEKWMAEYKSMLQAMPELVAEYSDFAPSAGISDNEREITIPTPPGYVSALGRKDLLLLLKEKWGIKHLIIGGIPTSGAVLATSLHGTDLDFIVSVVEDAVWDHNETVQNALLNSVLPVLAWVVKTEEAVGYISKD